MKVSTLVRWFMSGVAVAGAVAGAALVLSGSGRRLIGNPDSQVVHRPDCPHADPAKHTARFTTRRQAETAGFRPCRTCFH